MQINDIWNLTTYHSDTFSNLVHLKDLERETIRWKENTKVELWIEQVPKWGRWPNLIGEGTRNTGRDTQQTSHISKMISRRCFKWMRPYQLNANRLSKGIPRKTGRDLKTMGWVKRMRKANCKQRAFTYFWKLKTDVKNKWNRIMREKHEVAIRFPIWVKARNGRSNLTTNHPM